MNGDTLHVIDAGRGYRCISSKVVYRFGCRHWGLNQGPSFQLTWPQSPSRRLRNTFPASTFFKQNIVSLNHLPSSPSCQCELCQTQGRFCTNGSLKTPTSVCPVPSVMHGVTEGPLQGLAGWWGGQLLRWILPRWKHEKHITAHISEIIDRRRQSASESLHRRVAITRASQAGKCRGKVGSAQDDSQHAYWGGMKCGVNSKDFLPLYCIFP